jgi:hypothetical protein
MSVFGTFVTPASVRAEKDRIDPQIRALDAQAATCISPELRASWAAFVVGWNVFFHAPEGFLTAGAEYDHALAVERELNGWREAFRRECGLDTPPTEIAGDADRSGAQGLLTTVAVIAGIVGAVVLFRR